MTFGEDVPYEELMNLIHDLDMDEMVNKLPNGLNTLIGEKGCKLSSGEKQRVNIIRTIIEMRRNPNQLFLLDEITSNLDAHTRDLAIGLIDRECHSTLIVISHNEGFEAIVDGEFIAKDKCLLEVKKDIDE
jgi:ATP-binding cassette subfamily B protein